jgi:ATP-grasp domain
VYATLPPYEFQPARVPIGRDALIAACRDHLVNVTPADGNSLAQMAKDQLLRHKPLTPPENRRHPQARPQSVRAAAAELLGKTLVTSQTGPEGKPVQRVYVEVAEPFEREIYLNRRIG